MKYSLAMGEHLSRKSRITLDYFAHISSDDTFFRKVKIRYPYRYDLTQISENDMGQVRTAM